jgi:hypothetical protein
MPRRRFPPPWFVTELEACFVVNDGARQKLSYVYYEDEPQRRAAAKLLTKDEARSCRGPFWGGIANRAAREPGPPLGGPSVFI